MGHKLSAKQRYCRAGGGEMGAGGGAHGSLSRALGQLRVNSPTGFLPFPVGSLNCPVGQRTEAPATCGHGMVTFWALSTPLVQATPALAPVAGEM